MCVDDVAADADVDRHRCSRPPTGRCQAQRAVRRLLALHDAADRLADPLARRGGGGNQVVEPAGLPPQAELSRLDPAGDVLAGAAEAGKLEIVDDARPVGRQVRDDPPLDQVNQKSR
jgi:hypothetical protein